MSNRKVSTDALETLGQIITENEKRDAIHLAVEPIVATVKLYPGQGIGLVPGGAAPSDDPLGIVDPFLKKPVFPGERFWMILNPRMVHSLRHVWTHPAFADEGGASPAAESKSWLTRFAEDQAGISYDECMMGAEAYLKHGDYLCQGGRWEGFDVPDEFWVHYERVTGEQVAQENRGSFFTCSC